MKRKVEQEGYLQDLTEERPSKHNPKACAGLAHLQTQNMYYVPVQSQVNILFFSLHLPSLNAHLHHHGGIYLELNSIH